MRPSLTIAALACALVACLPRVKSTTNAISANALSPHSVSAIMHDATGRDLGTLTVAEAPQGLVVTGKLTGLPPGSHALHLHAVGKCEPPFTSAGGHWNPTAHQHGRNNPQGPHMGDMSNMTVGDDSIATVNDTTPGGTLRGEHGLLDADGAAIVVHAGSDDYHTDPAGNAGGRIACGIVRQL